jgi:hypothetical protein
MSVACVKRSMSHRVGIIIFSHLLTTLAGYSPQLRLANGHPNPNPKRG